MRGAQLEEALNGRVVGQPEAVKALVRSYQLAQLFAPEEGNTRSNLMLMGPSGVGKTKLVYEFAELVSGLRN